MDAYYDNANLTTIFNANSNAYIFFHDLYLEKYTGITVESYFTISYYMVIFQDELFTNFDPVIPENGLSFYLPEVTKRFKWT